MRWLPGAGLSAEMGTRPGASPNDEAYLVCLARFLVATCPVVGWSVALSVQEQERQGRVSAAVFKAATTSALSRRGVDRRPNFDTHSTRARVGWSGRYRSGASLTLS